MPLLSVRNLNVEYRLPDLKIAVKALKGVSMDINKGEIVSIVGESGSGKSTLALAIMRMLKPPAVIKGGNVYYNGVDLLSLSEHEFNLKYKWVKVSMVPQASQNIFNPTMRVKDHFLDTARAHGISDEADVLKRASEVLEFTKLDPARVFNLYPHQLSGGMKQRVAIALSLLLNPELVIMDEPTAALDVVTQMEILKLVKMINEELGTTIIFITHDISIVPMIASRVIVLYNGEVMEIGPTEDVIIDPKHPYTKALVQSTPSLSSSPEEVRPIPGEPPNPLEDIQGCPFWPRCQYAMDVCKVEKPREYNINGRVVRCYLYEK